MNSGKEWQKEAEAAVPSWIIQVAMGKPSISVIGKCVVDNKKDKKHGKGAIATRVGFRTQKTSNALHKVLKMLRRLQA